MKLDLSFYPELRDIKWLSACGDTLRGDFGFPVRWLNDRESALHSMFSSSWANATTAAQSALTGYLSKTHYDMYGGHWNRLAQESRKMLEEAIGDALVDSVTEGGWNDSLSKISLPLDDPRYKSAVGSKLVEILSTKDWTKSYCHSILVNLNRAALERSYWKKMPRTPIFFEHLFEIYKTGRLPCGWEGDLAHWPNGALIVY